VRLGTLWGFIGDGEAKPDGGDANSIEKLQKAEDNFRPPVFWQTPYCTFALLLGHLQCGVCVQPQSVACALAQGRLFCKVGFCVSA